MSVYGSKKQDIPKKKPSENFIEYFTHIFSTFLNSKIFRDNKIVVHSKPFVKIIGILL